jgi:2-haloacid dehalogenase
MEIDAFTLKREEILFAAFAGWDAAGAKWFGYPTF